MNLSVLLLCLSACFFDGIHGQALSNSNTNPVDDWKLEEVLSMITNDTARTEKINSVLSDLIAKADRLYRKVEGEVKDLAQGTILGTRLDPSILNKDCNCYCKCPENTINNKVKQDIELKVSNLKDKFKSLGSSIKKKIHQLTSQ